MDRFLDDRDSARQDFVRLEYSQVWHQGWGSEGSGCRVLSRSDSLFSQALKMEKLIVPVYKEDFQFPGAGNLLVCGTH